MLRLKYQFFTVIIDHIRIRDIVHLDGFHVFKLGFEGLHCQRGLAGEIPPKLELIMAIDCISFS